MDMSLTAYTVLGVAQTATADEIAAAYRAKAKEHHPDRGGDASTFRRIALAWSKLRSPEERAAYDRHLAQLAEKPASSASAPTETDARNIVERLQRAEERGDLQGELGELAKGYGLSGADADRIKSIGGKAATVARGVASLFGSLRGGT
jgi:curved DNA-binding protein CbpA